MEMTDVRIKLIQEPNDRLKAVCSITLDNVFVVRDMKVVEGSQGLFVAMPSRKLSASCQRCRSKNHLKARFCNECGSKLPPPRHAPESNGGHGSSGFAGRTKMHRDIAHPITTEFRELLQSRILESFNAELELARQPGYLPKDLDETDETVEAVETAPANDDETSEYDALIAGLRGRGSGEPPRRDSGGQRPPAKPGSSGLGPPPGRGPSSRSHDRGDSRRPSDGPARSSDDRGEAGQRPRHPVADAGFKKSEPNADTARVNPETSEEPFGPPRRDASGSGEQRRESAPIPRSVPPGEPRSNVAAPPAAKPAPPAKPAPVEVHDDGDDAFGAGIL